MSAWFKCKKVYAFDFWITLTHIPEMRKLARRLFDQGHEIHIVSAISPGLPLDNDGEYARMLKELDVPYTAIHRVDHVAAQKIAVLRKIKADGFWDDTPDYVNAARDAGFNAFLVETQKETD